MSQFRRWMCRYRLRCLIYLRTCRKILALTYIFISHDLSVVKFVSDRIMVMNKGRIEEIGAADSIYNNPQRDYTRMLIKAIPDTKLEDIQVRQSRRAEVVEKIAEAR
jgi:ABC-type oligopeptide transport system, ATPase component